MWWLQLSICLSQESLARDSCAVGSQWRQLVTFVIYLSPSSEKWGEITLPQRLTASARCDLTDSEKPGVQKSIRRCSMGKMHNNSRSDKIAVALSRLWLHQLTPLPTILTPCMEQSSNQCHDSNFSGFLQKTTKKISFHKVVPGILVCAPCPRSTFAHATLICMFLTNYVTIHSQHTRHYRLTKVNQET